MSSLSLPASHHMYADSEGQHLHVDLDLTVIIKLLSSPYCKCQCSLCRADTTLLENAGKTTLASHMMEKASVIHAHTRMPVFGLFIPSARSSNGSSIAYFFLKQVPGLSLRGVCGWEL